MSNQKILFKRGDTFSLQATANGEDITTWTIQSQIRDNSGTLISELDITKTDAANGEYTLTHDGATSSWPLKMLYCDIQYTVGGVISSTETFRIEVVEDITR